MYDHNIHEEEINVNPQDGSTIEMCPHEGEIPYAQIPNEILRSRDFSPECGHIIINLLSNKPGWRINVAQLINRYKGFWGRDKVYKYFNEAIKAGYVKKLICRDGKNKNRFGKITYIVARTPKFKETITVTCFQDPDGKEAENTYFKKNDKKERLSGIDKKNDNDSVHKSKCKIKTTKKEDSPSIDYRFLDSKKSIVSPPSERKGTGFDPATFNPETYRLPNGNPWSLRFKRAIMKYSQDDLAKLYANIDLLEEMCRKNPGSIENLESYLQSLINKNCAGKELERYQNWIFANFVIQDNKINNATLMKTVVKKNNKNGDSLSLSLPPHSFADALESFLGIRRV